MQIEVLQLDGAFDGQAGFTAACKAAGARFVDLKEDGKRVRLWARDPQLARLKAKLPQLAGPTLTFVGSGDFHHMSALLIDRASDVAREPITVVHFDNHPDWVRVRGGMHCGSWVTRALRIPEVAKIVTVGICSKDLQHPEWKGGALEAMACGKLEIFPYRQQPSAVSYDYGQGPGFKQLGRRIVWQTIEAMGLAAFRDILLKRIGTEAIYITFDKDVLAWGDAATNWDNGELRLGDVLGLIQALAAKHRIIGADVIGDRSAVELKGGWWTVLKKSGELAIDHRKPKLPADKWLAVNEAANLQILQAFSQLPGMRESTSVEFA